MIQCTNCWAEDAVDYEYKMCTACADYWRYVKKFGKHPVTLTHADYHPDDLTYTMDFEEEIDSIRETIDRTYGR